jgi:hypothetical protein
VFALLKGQVADTTNLVLITEGGQAGLDQQLLTNTLRLTAGQQGVFFLTPAPWPGLPITSGRAWTPFGSEQGFIRYNPAEGTATEPFRRYSALDRSILCGNSSVYWTVAPGTPPQSSPEACSPPGAPWYAGSHHLQLHARKANRGCRGGAHHQRQWLWQYASQRGCGVS